jgi:hypothetical protein
MAMFQRTEIVDKHGVLHVFTQFSWHTEYEAFNHNASGVKSAREILSLPAEVKYSWEYLKDLNQSVTMPNITRLTKKVTYESLPGLSGRNAHRTVSIGRAKAVLETRYQ